MQDNVDQNTEYELIVTVADFPEDNAHEVGTLIELAENWPLIAAMIYNKSGDLDLTMIGEPITMDMTIGLANYKLRVKEE